MNGKKWMAVLRGVVTLIVASAWAASIIADILLDGYSTHIALHGLMGTVLAWLFKGSKERKNDKTNS